MGIEMGRGTYVYTVCVCITPKLKHHQQCNPFESINWLGICTRIYVWICMVYGVNINKRRFTIKAHNNIYICICIYVYIYIRVYYIHTYIHIHIYIYTHNIYIYIYMYIHTHTHIYICIYIHTYVYIYSNKQCLNTCTYPYKQCQSIWIN